MVACLEMQRDVDEFNRNSPHDDLVVMKIGLHHGPTIAVESGGRIDYFGRTVNIAARLSAASVGRDIVTSAHVWERPETQQACRNHGFSLGKFQANLKGIQGVFTLYRLEIDEAK